MKTWSGIFNLSINKFFCWKSNQFFFFFADCHFTSFYIYVWALYPGFRTCVLDHEIVLSHTLFALSRSRALLLRLFWTFWPGLWQTFPCPNRSALQCRNPKRRMRDEWFNLCWLPNVALVFFHKNDEREELPNLIYDFWKVCMLAILNVFVFAYLHVFSLNKS